MLQNFFTLLSVAAPLALMIMLWVMAQISRRFGEVTPRPPLYRGFYVALLFLLFPLSMRLLTIGLDAPTDASTDTTLFHDLPNALSIVLAVFITWRYWGWLVYAREGQHPVKPHRTKPQ